jgi:hypothetical protein
MKELWLRIACRLELVKRWEVVFVCPHGEVTVPFKGEIKPFYSLAIAQEAINYANRLHGEQAGRYGLRDVFS